MKGYLEDLCFNLGIELVYMNNKNIFLSAGVKNNTPIIRVHQSFKQCPLKVANAILGYYTKDKDREENLNIINQYLKDILLIKNFKIKESSGLFKKAAIESMPSEIYEDEKGSFLKEYNISSIDARDFYGNRIKINRDKYINPSENDVLELNITVEPPIT